ncbi:MAG: FG-GAP repeat domain-containing protein, partial [Bacteroidia bacterium]
MKKILIILLVVCSQQTYSQMCLLNSTSANFSLGVGAGPYAVTNNDFNGDGKKDLAVANTSASNVSILLGTGNGSFGSPINFPVGSIPISITSNDFNADGNADLAVANTSSND